MAMIMNMYLMKDNDGRCGEVSHYREEKNNERWVNDVEEVHGHDHVHGWSIYEFQ